MNDSHISEDEFWGDWRVFKHSNGDLFEFEDIKGQPPNLVWTIVDSGSDEDDTWYALPGFHVVNKLGYVMTEKAWQDETREAIYFAGDGNEILSADD